MSKRKSLENFESLKSKGQRLEALIKLCNNIRDKEQRVPLSFNDFLYHATQEPELVFRNIFQLFHDMVNYYVPEGRDEYVQNEESVGFLNYDCHELFVNGCDNPFFADRIFANRFMNLAQDLAKSSINNHIYLFEGPPGSGKSTFLNNLLQKLELYTNMREGLMYNTLWHIDTTKMGHENGQKLVNSLEDKGMSGDISVSYNPAGRHFIDISCPSQDHPILQIPRALRKDFLDELITDKKFRDKLFELKEYEWIFKDIPCPICSSIYTALLDRLDNPLDVFSMLYARKANYNRQFGEGISVFNPGDPVIRQPIYNNPVQDLLRRVLKTHEVKFMYSYLANTNNGVFALMDIKENNIERLKSLHGIVSDGVHKVDFIEEQIKSLFVGLINPEDKVNYENIKSFQDRIVTVNIPYVLDYKTEVEIYKNKLGFHIGNIFLPRVLSNFAKIIVSTRLDENSPAIRRWITHPGMYSKFTDKNLLLLKMDVYSGTVPEWLTDEDVKRFTAVIRKGILEDSEKEGAKGFSGRQSLNIFSDFYNKMSDDDKLVTMSMVREYFKENFTELGIKVPEGFIQSLEDNYDYEVLGEVKEAIYYYNEKQISTDILNYLYAISFEIGETIICEYTGDKIEVSEDYFKNFEALFVGATAGIDKRLQFRKDAHAEYISKTLSRDIRVDKKKIEQTDQFKTLFEKYVKNLKENALAPFVDNENFRRALLDFETPQYATYDERLKRQINFMVANLQKKFKYTQSGALQVAIYVVDKKLHTKY